VFDEAAFRKLKVLAEQMYDNFVNRQLHPIYFAELVRPGQFSGEATEEIENFIKQDVFSSAQNIFELPSEKFKMLKNCKLQFRTQLRISDLPFCMFGHPLEEEPIEKILKVLNKSNWSPNLVEFYLRFHIYIPYDTLHIDPPRPLEKTVYMRNLKKIPDVIKFAAYDEPLAIERVTAKAVLLYTIYPHSNLLALYRMAGIFRGVCKVFTEFKDIWPEEFSVGISYRVAENIANELEEKYPSINQVGSFLQHYLQLLSLLSKKHHYYTTKVKEVERSASLKEIINNYKLFVPEEFLTKTKRLL
jgi:hypothetical protein